MTEVVSEVVDHVALITLNRPDRLNALDPQMTDTYLNLLLSSDEDPNVRAIVVTGAGRAFCAGAATGDLAEADTTALGASVRSLPRDAALRLRTPTIAAINGPAIGIGLAHALMMDVRFAAADATLGLAFSRLGLVAEMGTSWLLQRQVGRARALDLLLSSRTLTGTEAHAMGLVEQVVDPSDLLDAALRYARTIADNSAYSTAVIKEQVAQDADRTWQDAFADSNDRMLHSLERDEFRERLAALAARKK